MLPSYVSASSHPGPQAFASAIHSSRSRRQSLAPSVKCEVVSVLIGYGFCAHIFECCSSKPDL